MSLFEPVFLVLALVTLVALFTARVAALRRRFATARTILLRIALGALLYFAVALVSLVSVVIGDPSATASHRRRPT